MTPEGWRAATFGEYCRQISERARAEELPVLSVSKDLGIVLQSEKFKKRIASEDTSNYKRVRFGQFVYDPMLLWAGNVGRQRRVPEGVVSPAYTVFETSGLDDDYFEYFLKQPAMCRLYKTISRGTNVRRQKALFADFAALRFSCPPLSEQRKIAAILSSVDDAIEATQAVIDQLQVVKKAMMAELLTRGLPGRHTRFKQTAIGELPESWEVRRILDLAAPVPNAVTAGPFGTIFKAKDFRDAGVPIVQLRHVTEAGFKWGARTTYMDRDVYSALHQPYATRPADVLVTKLGDPPGLACLYPEGEPQAMVTPDVIKVTTDVSRLSPEFAVYMYNAAPTRGRLLPTTIGGTRPRMTLETFYALLLPVPPLEEQEEIASILRAADERFTQERSTADALVGVGDALGSALLSGDVRVPADEAAA